MSKRIIVRFVCLFCLTLFLVIGYSGYLVYSLALEYNLANKLNTLEYGSEVWVLEATRQAERGYVHAQHSLGRFYLGYYRDVNGNSYGTANLEEGVKWIRKAAERGDATAQIDLSRCYAMGKGVPKDGAKAIKWLRKAAEQGDDYAMYALGASYYYGSDDLPKDKVKAVKWFRKAAENGSYRSVNAMHALSMCLYHGEGVPENKAEAEKWLNKAKEAGWNKSGASVLNPPEYQCEEWLSETKRKAEQGDANAQYMLGQYYSHRKYEGVISEYTKRGTLYEHDYNEENFAPPLDMEEALKWFRKAAEQGHGFAIWHLNGSMIIL